MRAAAQEDLVDAELALGHHADLVPQLEELVDAHPYDERARAQLMLALYRSGRQADALGAFQETRQSSPTSSASIRAPRSVSSSGAILLQEPSLVSPDGDAPATAERRKTVTAPAALSPSEELDPEPQRAALVRGVAAARAAVEHHEGWVTARADEELMGVFGVPESHEDDALRAVRAATELRQAIAAEDELELRVGIDAGEALTGHGFVSGDVTRIAARLQRSAKPGEILLGRTALDLVGHAVEGRRSRVGFRLESVQIDAPAVAQQVEAPLVGRGPELDSLVEQFERARSERCCRSFCWSASRASARAAWRVSCRHGVSNRTQPCTSGGVWRTARALRIYPCGRFLPRSTSTRRSGTWRTATCSDGERARS